MIDLSVILILFILGFLTRVILYIYRILYQPNLITNKVVVKNTFNKWMFIIHIVLTNICSFIILPIMMKCNSWLGFVITDIFIWVTSLLIVILGFNQTSRYGNEPKIFILTRNVLEFAYQMFVMFMFRDISTHYNLYAVIPWGIFLHRITDTYPRQHIFVNKSAWNAGHLVITYALSLIFGFTRQSTFIGNMIALNYIMYVAYFYYSYLFTYEGWRDLGALFPIYRLFERNNLQKNNIYTHPINNDEETLKFYQDELTKSKIDTNKYRTISGYGNNPNKKESGAIYQYFGRNILEKNVSDGIKKYDPLDPNPLMIANMFFKRDEKKFLEKSKKIISENKEYPNALFGIWIQFMIEDWFISDIDQNDKLKISYDDEEILIKNDKVALEENDVKYIKNNISHWWQLSQVYGKTYDESIKVRVFNDENKKGFLKINDVYLDLENGKELTGSNVNMSSMRGVLHYMFAKEHNRIALALSEKYPNMSAEEIYQTAKMINIIVMMKIHAIEWTPVLNNTSYGEYTMYTLYNGIIPSLKKYIGKFSKLFGNTVNGIFGGKLDNKFFTHTQEFLSVYRMHSFMPTFIDIFDINDKKKKDTLRLREQIFSKSPSSFYNKGYTVEEMLYLLGVTPCGEIDIYNTSADLMNINMDGIKLNIVANDIYKDRKRGVPRYNDFRKGLGLPSFNSFEHFIKYNKQNDKDYDYNIVLNNLKKAYGNDINKMDLALGFALEKKPYGFFIPDTIYYIFSFQTQRRIEEDMFVTEKLTPEYYTDLGIEWINTMTFSKLIKEHYPQLAKNTKLEDDSNPFVTWNNLSKKVKRPTFLDISFPYS